MATGSPSPSGTPAMGSGRRGRRTGPPSTGWNGSAGPVGRSRRPSGQDPEPSVERPVGGVLAVEDPDASAGRGGHVERRERHPRRPGEPQRRAARVQVEDQEPGGVERTDDEVMLLGDRQPGERHIGRGRLGVERLKAPGDVAQPTGSAADQKCVVVPESDALIRISSRFGPIQYQLPNRSRPAPRRPSRDGPPCPGFTAK